MLTRDKDFIQKNLYIKDNKIYTKQKTIIEFPKWYENKELLDIQNTVYLYGIFATIIDNKYSVSVIPTLVNTTPIVVNEIERNGEVYTQFVYGKDDCIIDSTNVVKKDLLSYNLFEGFFIYAKIPWFIDYEDLIKIMDNILKYANSNLGSNYISTELVISFIARIKSNKAMFYRQDPKKEIEYVDLMNVYYSVLNTTSKISGNYFTESLVSAIVQKQDTVTKLESLVRR